MTEYNSNSIIKKINYKDLLIIFGSWYFMVAFHLMLKEISFKSPLITDFFHFLFILSGRFIFLTLLIFYLTYFYTLNFKELGFNFTSLKEQILLSLSLGAFLLITVIFLINIPLSLIDNGFTPIYKLNSPDIFISTLPPLFLLFSGFFIISLSQQFLLCKIIYELFNYTIFNRFFSLILTALLSSIILLNFNPPRILMNFIISLISLILYLRYDSIIISSLFLAWYYAIYIIYIYGWAFLSF